MSVLPDKAAVLGSGAGALTIAAELALAGVEVILADFPQFFGSAEAIKAAGGIEVRCDWHGSALAPVTQTSVDPVSAIEGAPLVVVSVPSFGHALFADAMAPILREGQIVMWVGEGGGSLAQVAAMRAIHRNVGALGGETNTLPYAARLTGPGAVAAQRKRGGTLVAALPTTRTEDVYAIASAIWPWVTRAENAWETILINFNAIDHVAALLLNLGSAEGRRGPMLLWGEGATPGVVKAIAAVDAELLLIRRALGLRDQTRYEDFLVAQGFVDEVKGSLHATIHASRLESTTFLCGPDALEHRFLTEDIPFGLALAASIGDEAGVDTPLIDALVTLGSAVTGRDLRATGRTLATWDLEGAGVDGLLDAVSTGWW